jgi:hypothetical protein
MAASPVVNFEAKPLPPHVLKAGNVRFLNIINFIVADPSNKIKR